MNPLKLFRKNHDYIEIGNLLGIHESQVEKLIHVLRSEEIARRAETSFRIPYAGKPRSRTECAQ